MDLIKVPLTKYKSSEKPWAGDWFVESDRSAQGQPLTVLKKALQAAQHDTCLSFVLISAPPSYLLHLTATPTLLVRATPCFSPLFEEKQFPINPTLTSLHTSDQY